MHYSDFSLMVAEAKANVEQAEMLMSEAAGGNDEAAYAEARDELRIVEFELETLRNTRLIDYK